MHVYPCQHVDTRALHVIRQGTASMKSTNIQQQISLKADIFYQAYSQHGPTTKHDTINTAYMERISIDYLDISLGGQSLLRLGLLLPWGA